MSCFLLLLLVGTIYAQLPENNAWNDSEGTAGPDCQENEGDIDLENCHNITLELKNGPENPDICPGKKSCSYCIYTCKWTFWTAQNACTRSGGNLASIHNAGANNQLVALVKKANLGWIWIGVSRTNRNGYRNVDGSRLDYTNFAYAQRQNSGNWGTAINPVDGLWYAWNYCTLLTFACII